MVSILGDTSNVSLRMYTLCNLAYDELTGGTKPLYINADDLGQVTVYDFKINDNFDFSVYHRCLSTNVEAKVANPGDTKRMARYNMQMIVTFNKAKIQFSEEDMIVKLNDFLDTQFDTNDLFISQHEFVKIAPMGTNTSSSVLYKAEYGTLDNCPLKPVHSYFAVNYMVRAKIQLGNPNA